MAACNNNGKCLTMSQLAQTRTVDGALSAVTYGATPNTAATWDADKIHGCYCHDGYYAVPDRATGVLSYYCSHQPCPYGDDPRTPTVEMQTATCTATAGAFKLLFDDGARHGAHTTAAIAFDATAAVVEARLEALPSIQDVAVVFSTGTAACSGAGVGIAVTFTDTNSVTADLNLMTVDASETCTSPDGGKTCEAVTLDGVAATCTGTNDGGGTPCLHWKGDTALQAGAGTVTFAETTKGDFTQSFEVQTLTCIATSGTFTLTFRGQATAAIAFDAGAGAVEAALEFLSSVNDVTVALSTGTAACAASPGVGIAVRRMCV